MNLEKNYQLLNVVRDDGIRTLQAKEIASGRELEVHLFVKAEDHALFDRLRSLPLSARRPLLELGSEMTIPFIVTDPVPAETNARAWLTTLMKPVPSSPDSKPQPIKASVWKTGTPLPDPLFPPDAADAAPGEFTRMFKAPAAEPAAPAEAPGEFTRMFQSPAAPETEPDIKTRTMQAPAPPPAPAPASDATRLFQIPEPAPPPAAEPAAPPAKEAGEFTKLFQCMQASPASAPAAPEPSGPGEFTRMFQSPLSPGLQNRNAAAGPFQAAPPPPPPRHEAGEFTQLFGTPSGGAAPKAAPPLGGGQSGASATGAFASPAPPSPHPSRAPAQQGPGQFTQMMSAGSAPSLGQPSEAPVQAPAAPKTSNMALMVILGALGVFAILLIAFFALRH